MHSGAVLYSRELCFTVTSAITATALQTPKPRVHYFRRGAMKAVVLLFFPTSGVCVHSAFVIKGGSYYSGDITDMCENTRSFKYAYSEDAMAFLQSGLFCQWPFLPRRMDDTLPLPRSLKILRMLSCHCS